MGIPISPDDPSRGGCPVCVGFIPETLYANYFAFESHHWSGEIFKLPLDPKFWQGWLESDTTFDDQLTVTFCLLPDSVTSIGIGSRPPFQHFQSFCELPLDRTDPVTGDRLLLVVP